MPIGHDSFKSPHGRGVIYVATGEKYLKEMLFSAASVKKYLPNLPITVFTDLPDSPIINNTNLIDNIELIENPIYSFGDKICPLKRSPYLETLFLDADTVIVNNCEEIFEPLRHNDLAVTFNGYRSDFAFEELPQSCPSYNTGVIVFRNNSTFQKFIDDWIEKQKEYSKFRPDDQPSFRYCVNKGKIRTHTLPIEYNFYSYFPESVGGFARIKILHGCGPHADEIARVLDRSSKGPAIYGPIELTLICHWYWTKFRKVLRRVTNRRWR